MESALFSLWHSPLGWIGIAATARGLAAVTSPRPSRSEARIALEQQNALAFRPGDNHHLRATRTALEHYFKDGANSELAGLTLDPTLGTHFQRRVWKLLRSIPFGGTTTYSHLARAAGRPRAVRAIGQCNARNPFAIVVPCHRVLGVHGELTGYAGGIELKRRLLRWEQQAARRRPSRAPNRRRPGHAHRH